MNHEYLTTFDIESSENIDRQKILLNLNTNLVSFDINGKKYTFNRSPKLIFSEFKYLFGSNFDRIRTTLTANGWDKYGWYNNFELFYPAHTYDITMGISENCTLEEYLAFRDANIVGLFPNRNELKSFGKTPKIDIPVVLTLTLKEGVV